MHILVKTFMVDATDMTVKYVVIHAGWSKPKVNVQKHQAEKAVEALARRVQTRRALQADIVKLLTEHLAPATVDVSVN